MSTVGVPVPVPVTPAQLRADFVEFANATVFPDSSISYYANLALLMLNQQRWGTLLGTGIELFIAHNIKMEADNQSDAVLGNTPGLTKGPVSSESVGKVSVNYDTANALDPKATHWNLTNYGVRFWQLSRLIGAGPIHLSGCGAGGASFSAGVFGPF